MVLISAAVYGISSNCFAHRIFYLPFYCSSVIPAIAIRLSKRFIFAVHSVKRFCNISRNWRNHMIRNQVLWCDQYFLKMMKQLLSLHWYFISNNFFWFVSIILGREKENLLTCLADLFHNIKTQKKRVGTIAPKRFITKLKKENGKYTMCF